MEYTAIQGSQRSLNESLLVMAVQQGDHEAFNQLVLAYQEAVFNLAYRIMGELDSADDVTQDAFLSAYRNLSRFRNGSFRSWLFRITTNLCYDELRRRKRHPLLSIESEDGMEEGSFPPSDWPEPEISVEQTCEQYEFEQAVQQLLNLLSPVLRAVVVLVDLQEMDYREAAQVLGIPVGTVKSRLARGRRDLRRLVTRHGI